MDLWNLLNYNKKKKINYNDYNLELSEKLNISITVRPLFPAKTSSLDKDKNYREKNSKEQKF